MSRIVFKRVTENQLADRDNKFRLDAKMEGNINGVLAEQWDIRSAGRSRIRPAASEASVRKPAEWKDTLSDTATIGRWHFDLFCIGYNMAVVHAFLKDSKDRNVWNIRMCLDYRGRGRWVRVKSKDDWCIRYEKLWEQAADLDRKIYSPRGSNAKRRIVLTMASELLNMKRYPRWAREHAHRRRVKFDTAEHLESLKAQHRLLTKQIVAVQDRLDHATASLKRYPLELPS